MVSKKEIDEVWEKGRSIKGKDPDLYRKDAHGNEIYKPSYGKNGEKSWEIDHKVPVAKGGSDSMKNKQPLQTDANRQKSDTHPVKPGSLKQRGK
ncbi:HNH endonuclease domain-containing protein [Burkholderia thailandensis]|uniref:HNH endonuclease domain-containing protein n=1 Tax=Burkholderia thailandensis TaxID=57975 RepID=UPI003F90C8E4